MVISRETKQNAAGLAYGILERWQVSGFLQASDQSSLSSAINLLIGAYQANYLPAGLFLDDGTPTPHQLPGLSPLGGTRVVQQPSFPEGGGGTAEYTTFRTYSLALESEYLIPGGNGTVLLSWVETLAFHGGGPRFVYLQPLIGVPQKQRTAETTPYRVSQFGEAVGLGGYPIPPLPIWPAAEHEDRRQITPRTPKRTGGNSPRYLEFPLSWSYEFEDAVPLDGLPTLWQ